MLLIKIDADTCESYPDSSNCLSHASSLSIVSTAYSFVAANATVEEGPNEDVCGLNYFLNKVGQCMKDNECRTLATIVTDQYQPM